MCDTIDAVIDMAYKCIDLLRRAGLTKMGKVIFEPDKNPDGTPKDWIGAMIFNYMEKLHQLRFGLFTNETMYKLKYELMDRLLRTDENVEPYKAGDCETLSFNVLGYLETIIRLLIQYDARFEL